MRDNEVYIDTTLNTDGVEIGTKKVNKALLGLQKTVKMTGKIMSKTLAGAGIITIGLAQDAKNFFNAFRKDGVKSLLRYAIGVRSVFVLVNKLRSAIIDGMKNLVQFNDGINPVNTSLSNLQSVLFELKNAMATAFAPILTVVEPLLTKLIAKITQATTAIGMFFASLSGQTTFTKAVAVQKDYAKSLATTEKNAKKLKNQLSGLDEINIYKSNNEESTSTDFLPNQMFETVPIDNAIIDFANEIKEAWGDGGVTGVFNVLKTLWEKLPESIKKIVKTVAELWLAFKGVSILINVIDLFAKLTGSFTKAIGLVSGIIMVIGGAFTAVYEFVKMWQEGFSWIREAIMLVGIALTALGAIILGAPAFVTAIIAGIVASVATLVIVIKDHWDDIVAWWNRTVVKGLKMVVQDFKNLGNNILSAVMWVKDKAIDIWTKLKDTTVKIFSSMWDGIKKTINAIIGGIEGMANAVVKGINRVIEAMNRLSFTIPSWVPEMGGKSFGFNIPTLSEVSIPRLATGTVVPRQAHQFMAVLGDNNKETEVVSPLSTMKQAMIEALSEVGGIGGSGQYQFTAQINRRTLFDEFIEEAKMRQLQTGRNPLTV